MLGGVLFDRNKCVTGRRFVMIGIILGLLVLPLAIFLPVPFSAVAGLFNLAAFIFCVIGMLRLLSVLGYSMAKKILLIILVFIPVINLIEMVVVSVQATRALSSEAC